MRREADASAAFGDMTSWNCLPYEIRSLIILHFVRSSCEDRAMHCYVSPGSSDAGQAVPNAWQAVCRLPVAIPALEHEVQHVTSLLLAEREKFLLEAASVKEMDENELCLDEKYCWLSGLDYNLAVWMKRLRLEEREIRKYGCAISRNF